MKGLPVDEQEIGIGELARAVRRELASLDSGERAEGIPALLALEEVELELSFSAVKRSDGH
jgi:hypothetical protein